MTFDAMWAAIEPIGRNPSTGGYRRFAWTREDAVLGEWFVGECAARGLDVALDRDGNTWGWWGDPDAAAAAGMPGLVIGSHLDSVPDGGAYDGPLGVVSAFAALDVLRDTGWTPRRPVAVVRFGDEEGARFGVACAGSRLLTGALDADRARALVDADGVSMAEAMSAAGHESRHLGRDDETLRRIGTFVELHVEQGKGLVDLGGAVGVGSGIWAHGRWRLDLRGTANHAGTTRLDDRDDPMLRLAAAVLAARSGAQARDAVATIGKVRVDPGAVNAIPSAITAWLDARGLDAGRVRSVVDDVASAAATPAVEESWTPAVTFAPDLTGDLARAVGDSGDSGTAPTLSTGAGHDAGILAEAGVPSGMLFVRNPTGVSHSPAESADRQDCLAGVAALARVVRALA